MAFLFKLKRKFELWLGQRVVFLEILHAVRIQTVNYVKELSIVDCVLIASEACQTCLDEAGFEIGCNVLPQVFHLHLLQAQDKFSNAQGDFFTELWFSRCFVVFLFIDDCNIYN